MRTTTLSLYYYPSCPFCGVVVRAIARIGVDVELRNIQQDPAHLHALLEATGRATVPCLRIDDEGASSSWMHESADIIEFLEDEAA
jgi:glutaredoxin